MLNNFSGFPMWGYLGLIMMLTALGVFVFYRRHLLAILMSLEGMMLGQFFLMMNMFMLLGYELYFILMFLVLMVCEAALGLSILVSIVRSHGNDYFNSLTILQC
uniref:NADH-ubiquinone oxidoreductase chain 4L n=1 Tax=Lepidurus apus lubbocki TaxID=217954 RepID=A0A5B7XV18_9CRUS|nr:NADH dehydrogenase subunit 4L [Lepidurus apus lubbocki]QCZ36058.1 NADH dehydrogenase subunit 4L [Lepidurus apus lubbocki]